MMMFAGTLAERKYAVRASVERARSLFMAVFNALYSCCWMYNADAEFDIVLETIRMGAELPSDHALIVERDKLDQFVKEVIERMRAGGGPAQG
jgi:hypothetical protein